MEGLLPPRFPEGRFWVRSVMAMTLDGAVRGADGGSRSISTPADQRWFSSLRSGADVVLVGAGTIRAEDYRPSGKVVAVVTESLNLPSSLRMFREHGPEHARPLVITTATAAEDAPDHLRQMTDIVPCGESHVHLATVLQVLRDRGLLRVQCEGGPRLLSELIAAGLLDQLLLSVTPRLVGGDASDHVVTVPGGLADPAQFRLAELHHDEGTAFLELVRV
jgi:riboflavin-specific deaminase-like protein